MRNKSYQKGMTLIEIMVALLIGAFLLGGVLEIFVGTKQTNRMQEGLSRVQENGRFALDFLTKDIRMTGFWGCNSQAPLTNNLNLATDFLNSFDIAIQGFEATSSSAWTPAINAAITSPLGGSDVITIRRADDQSFTVTAHGAATADLTLGATASTANLKKADFLDADSANNCAIAVVSDCSAATVFQITGIAGSVLSHATGTTCLPDNSTDNLGKNYIGGDVYPINTISYYIRNNNEGNPSLYRKVASKDAQELVEGIEQMQILYGIDDDDDDDGNLATLAPDGPANYYVTANTIPDLDGNGVLDWHRIVSVRISLLVSTIQDNLTSEPVAYTYNGATTTPGDHKLRRVFTTTIAVRNRLQ